MTAPSGNAALANARKVTTYPAGYCLKYVRAEAWQIGSLYGSAIDAWYGAINRHPGDRKPPIGAPMFYSGGQYGHIVINTQPGDIRSTDNPSSGRVGETDIDWPVRNWGQTYLGWAEDLNGVSLPLGDDDEMNNEDWQKLRSIVADEIAKNNPPLVDKVWSEETTVTKPSGQDEKKSTRQVIRETWQRVANLTV